MASHCPHPITPNNLPVPDQKLPTNPPPVAPFPPQLLFLSLHLPQLSNQPLCRIRVLKVARLLAQTQRPCHAQRFVQPPGWVGVDGERRVGELAVAGNERWRAEADDGDGSGDWEREVGV